MVSSHHSSGSRHTLTAQILHWMVAILMIWAVTLGWFRGQHFSQRKSIGVTVFLLALVRIGWRFTHQPPPLASKISLWQRRAVHLMHMMLYVMMLAIPLSGYFYSASAGKAVNYLGMVSLPKFIALNSDLKPVFKLIHISLNYALLGLLAMHLLAVIKHQFVDQN